MNRIRIRRKPKPLIYGLNAPFPSAHWWEYPSMKDWLSRHPTEEMLQNRRRILAGVLCWMVVKRVLRS